MIRVFFSILFVVLGCLGCESNRKDNFIGKWQSLNDPKNVIEFTENKVIFYKDGQSFWSKGTKHGELNYKVKSEGNNWYSFSTFDGNDQFFKGRLEFLKSGRIRIYILKHHDILDLADEYSRTTDFKSFHKIMSTILKEPEN